MTSAGTSPQKSGLQSTAELIDRASALSRVDGDGELMASLVDIFMTEAVAMMEAIRAAVGNSDAGKLEKAAHKLKGSVSIFSADAVSQTAYELEKSGRSKNTTNAADTLVRLEQQMTDLRKALEHFRNELNASSK